jgi:acetyltransferase-like isoleucine patch superfamily enzyme
MKKLIINLLPYGLVNLIRKLRGSRKADFSEVMNAGDSIFFPTFNIIKVIKRKNANKAVNIGNDNILGCQILFESDKGEVIIGNRVYIGDSKIICRSRIEFGNDIFVAWGCYFYDHDSHPLDYKLRQKDLCQQLKDYRSGQNFIANKNWDVVASKPIKICDNAWIGMNVMILKGVTIGEASIVAAGSIVTKDVPPHVLVGGNPAKIIRQLR